jgi:hypothetical protein
VRCRTDSSITANLRGAPDRAGCVWYARALEPGLVGSCADRLRGDTALALGVATFLRCDFGSCCSWSGRPWRRSPVRSRGRHHGGVPSSSTTSPRCPWRRGLAEAVLESVEGRRLTFGSRSSTATGSSPPAGSPGRRRAVLIPRKASGRA